MLQLDMASIGKSSGLALGEGGICIASICHELSLKLIISFAVVIAESSGHVDGVIDWECVRALGRDLLLSVDLWTPGSVVLEDFRLPVVASEFCLDRSLPG